MRTKSTFVPVVLAMLAGILQAYPQQQQPSSATSQSTQQTETDEYTRYELLAPETASFKIYYEVTATTAGAKRFYNPIRKGSTASDESVLDAMTGAPLHFQVVSGAEAKQDPLMARADAETDYIRVDLARPVPEKGQGRIVILKTYKDTKSYYSEGDTIVFNRPLGVRRNKVVLPAGYELIACNVPSQILAESDGRISISFMNGSAGEAPLVVKSKPGAQIGPAAASKAPTSARSWEAPFAGQTERARLSERAHQDRDIVYFLNPPETHSFSLYHDYSESRPGVDKYLNVVRAGSTVSNPSAYILDTGEVLPSKIMTGSELASAKIDVGEESLTPTTQVVVIPFTPVKKGESVRLRIAETYTAPQSYRIDGDELVFDRSLGRSRNAVVLPQDWYLTASAIPATVQRLPDGRIRLDFWNGRPDDVDVLIKARKTKTTSVAP